MEFAEIRAFIDTPVKRYSSGMQARLGFAVAAHLEPDVLVVDEVLAVGDAAFQAKAFARVTQLVGLDIPVVVVETAVWNRLMGRECFVGPSNYLEVQGEVPFEGVSQMNPEIALETEVAER